MKHIGVREFKDRANALLSADEPLIIERHGRAIGAYYYSDTLTFVLGSCPPMVVW